VWTVAVVDRSPHVARRLLRGTLATALLIALISFAARAALLGRLGRMMTASDPLAPAELAVLTPESINSVLDISDLVRDRLVKRVAVLVSEPTPAARELERRGIRVGPVDVLVQLGVPSAAIVTIPAGEGGTTESTKALADWCFTHPADGIIVVVGATHAGRYRRALGRVWRGPGPLPSIRATRFDQFRADDWWRSRRTLRDGILELEKLLLDHVTHPL
jgi:hypothetical protein